MTQELERPNLGIIYSNGPRLPGQDDLHQRNHARQLQEEITFNGVPLSTTFKQALKIKCGLTENFFPKGTPSPDNLLRHAFGEHDSLVLDTFRDQLALRMASTEVLEDPDLEKAREVWKKYCELLEGVCGQQEEAEYQKAHAFLTRVLGEDRFAKLVVNYQEATTLE